MIRNEIKVPININENKYFFNWVNKFRYIKKQYNKRKITSIYYDDFLLSNAKNNVFGLSNRKKIRFRWYNNEFEKTFLEIKIRQNKLLSKKVYKLESNDYIHNYKYFNYFNNFTSSNNHINYLKKYFYLRNYSPIIKIKYLRYYFIYFEKIRITFDVNISYEMLKQNINKNNKIDNLNIVEFKFDPKNYDLATYLISRSKFIPKRNSKYLRGLYINNIIDNY